MGKIDLFAIGASAGGLEALKSLVTNLPREFPACICIVVHMSPNSPGLIPEILSAAGPLPAHHASDGNRLTPGCIFVARPDHHLIIDRELRLRLGRGPKENRFRPAVDPLFRSAALALDGRSAGILLSGGLDDGVAGLLTIRRNGGAVIVQDPADAQNPSMPKAALQVLEPDQLLPAHRIADAMADYATSYTPRAKEAQMTDDLNKEVEVAVGAESHPIDVSRMGDPTLLTCPDCHGALVRLRNSIPPRFRCHTGHAYTIESLEAATKERVEESLWNSVRCLEEHAMLLDHLAAHGRGGPDDAKRSAAESRRRSELLRSLLRRDA